MAGSGLGSVGGFIYFYYGGQVFTSISHTFYSLGVVCNSGLSWLDSMTLTKAIKTDIKEIVIGKLPDFAMLSPVR